MNVLKHYNLAVPVTMKEEQIAQSMVFEFVSQVDTSQVDVSQVDVSQVDESFHIAIYNIPKTCSGFWMLLR